MVGSGASAGLSRLQKGLVGTSAFVFVGSVIGRLLTRTQATDASPEPIVEGTGLGSGVGPEAFAHQPLPQPVEVVAPEPTTLELALPYLTEASLSALLGFAVGYATRKIMKVALILVAVVFVSVQVLASQGVIEVDWSGMLGTANELILNVNQNHSWSEMLTHRLPATGAFLAGLLIGFRRG